MFLTCDKREKILSYFPKLDWIKFDTLITGDYAITFENKNKQHELLFLFERKTWQDLAASIKDGRIREQKAKMSKINCPSFIIIEGKMCYKPEVVVGGIEFSKLDAMRRSLMMSGFPHVQTKNPEHTVYFLLEFTKQLANQRISTFEIDQKEAIENVSVNEFTKKEVIENEQIENNCAVLEDLKKMVELTPKQKSEKIWLSLPKVGPTLINCIQKVSLFDYFMQTPEWQQLNLVYASGRKCNIKTALNEFLCADNYGKLLEHFPKIGKVKAEKILKSTGFDEFIRDLKFSNKKNKTETMLAEILSYKL